MSQALPITGRPRIDQFKDLANCLRDILGELPDQDDITDALNVAVKLDKMLEFVGSFPSSAALTEMARRVAAMDARFTALSTQIALTQRMLTTENRDIVETTYPMWNNETWRDVGDALNEATTGVSVKVKSLAAYLNQYGRTSYGYGIVEFGMVRAGETEVEVLTDPMTVSKGEQVVELPDRLPAGAQIKMRSQIRNDFNSPPTARRVRVNTLNTQWGGHVYCYFQSHEDSTAAYSWEYATAASQHLHKSTTGWYDFTRSSTRRDLYPGHDTNWLCFPSERPSSGYVNAVRCKVTLTRRSDDTEYILRSPYVRVHDEPNPAKLAVTAVIFS